MEILPDGIHLTPEERRLLGAPPFQHIEPLKSASEILLRAEERISRLANFDPTDYPLGDRAQHIRNTIASHSVIFRNVVVGLAGTVAQQGVEKFEKLLDEQ